MVRITTQEVQPFEKVHLTRLRALAPECMVLLKKNTDFPLSSPCKLALYGSGARETVKGGTGSGDVNVRRFVTVEEGLENAGFTITTKTWLEGYRAAKDAEASHFLDDIRAEAKAQGRPPILVGMGKTPPQPRYALPLEGEGEVCVYVLARSSGEGTDRTAGEGDFQLTADEVRDILLCAKQYTKFMLVLNVGSPVDLSPVLDETENILLLSQLGAVTGDAFADVLLGKACPSGKLTTTWAKATDYASLGDFAAMDDTRYREGIYVGYRYFDAARIHPIFPFGFGLSYTDFKTVITDFRAEHNTISVSVMVTYTGRFTGKETVQLYYGAPEGKLSKPLRELGAYCKTKELSPGESESLTLSLPIENMASWDSRRDCWLLEKGDYCIYIGEEVAGLLSLNEDTVTARGSHVGGEADFEDWAGGMTRSVKKDVPRIYVQAAELGLAGHYDRNRIRSKVLPFPEVTTFTDRELASICVGKHEEGQAMSFIGNGASTLAGGAGETASLVSERGFGSLLMADGPAGLRIATRYLEDAHGQESLDTGSLDAYISLLPPELKELVQRRKQESEEKAKRQTVLYHYASAIPIGTALAQAWNPLVAEACGDIVGEEMELFGVNVWLAPALNIHRSPLCGRNFEYYSEDPLLSGKTAAAVTRWVQGHEKCAVTIKHFACNNQETNRFGSNSIVSQRALREIYLKGFEICVKEASPQTVMSSYNLLNGIHTANRHDLLTDLLRGEWGFAGIVMTDWGTTSDKFCHGEHGPSSAAGCIKAGNDLIMPGGEEDIEGILAGLQTGEITREELELCARRILAVAKGLS